MKKIISCVAVAMTIASASAQITVSSNGQALFGERMYATINSGLTPTTKITNNGTLLYRPYVEVDTLANAVFLGPEKDNGGGYITFGGARAVYVGELKSDDTSSRSNILALQGYSGLQARCRGGVLFSFNAPVATHSQFTFYTDVRANGFITDSDSRLKSNVSSLDNSASLLSRLSPISYTLVAQEAQKAGKATAESAELSGESISASPLSPDDRTRFGFMAQEVQDILPQLVVEDADGTLGIDYIGFIPLLVDAVKSLQAKVEEQEEQIALLSTGDNRRKAAPSSVADSRMDLIGAGAVLAQNSPNPFSNSTVIKCNIPEGVSESSIFIYDLQGKQIARMEIAERGDTSVTVEASSLQPGMYIYTLVADGVEIDSKRMILTD